MTQTQSVKSPSGSSEMHLTSAFSWVPFGAKSTIGGATISVMNGAEK